MLSRKKTKKKKKEKFELNDWLALYSNMVLTIQMNLESYKEYHYRLISSSSYAKLLFYLASVGNQLYSLGTYFLRALRLYFYFVLLTLTVLK